MKLKAIGLVAVYIGWWGCAIEAPDICTNPPTIKVSNTEMPDCGQPNGMLTLTATGGKAPYTLVLNDTLSQNETSFVNLKEGEYTLQITDANNCSAILKVTLETKPTDLSVSAINTHTAGCNGTSGIILLEAVGGAGPYDYALNGGPFQEASRFDNLAYGSYQATVRDTKGCEVSQEVYVPSGESYSASVEGIIQANCATSGCHGDVRQPILNSLEQIQSFASRIRARTQAGTMPPNATLSQAEIDIIACWVDDGARNN